MAGQCFTYNPNVTEQVENAFVVGDLFLRGRVRKLRLGVIPFLTHIYIFHNSFEHQIAMLKVIAMNSLAIQR